MSYTVAAVFYSLQGEGVQTGRPSVFCRFAGCNLSCPFCDTAHQATDGPSGGQYDSAEALAAVMDAARASPRCTWAVLTGGEPALQADDPLITALHTRGFRVAIETNGTRPLPPGLDWVCVSPKAGAPLAVTAGQELKLPFPQAEASPEQYESLDFAHFSLQPIDGPHRDQHTRAAVEYCLQNSQWRLSLQVHKLLGIP